MKMKRGATATRVRRRQSDAKWRASVATCYDTLKCIIPDSKKLSKRKVSKAFILRETERHIGFLEDILSTLLTERANKIEEPGSLLTLDDLKSDFESKQAAVFTQCSQGRKRYNVPLDLETNMFDVPQTATNAKMAKLSERKRKPKSKTATKQKQQHLSEIGTIQDNVFDNTYGLDDLQGYGSSTDQQSTLRSLYQQSFDDTAQHCQHLLDQDTPDKMGFDEDYPLGSPAFASLLTGTPVKQSLCGTIHGYGPDLSPQSTLSQLTSPHMYSPIIAGNVFATPSKDNSPNVFSSSQKLVLPLTPGFTPVKIPEYAVQMETPLKLSFGHEVATPNRKLCLDSDDESDETKSLLCTESIEGMDQDETEADLESLNNQTPRHSEPSHVSQPHTPCSSEKIRHRKKYLHSLKNGVKTEKDKRRSPKCRKQLERFYGERNVVDKTSLTAAAEGLDKDFSCLDFDGYYWFYQHVAQRMTPPIPKSKENDPKLAAAVTKMWKELGDEERNTMVTMAALDSSQDSDGSHLSDDLLDVNVVPINEVISFQLKDSNFGPDATVPSSMNADCFSVTETDLHELGLQLVPSESDHWSSSSSQPEVNKYEISTHQQYISLVELASFDILPEPSLDESQSTDNSTLSRKTCSNPHVVPEI